MTSIPHEMMTVRSDLATRYISGSGIEIGALDAKFPTGSAQTISYVDRLSADDLRLHYPELAERELIDPDVIDNGEILSSFPFQSVDFIIASHMLEHTQNPIGTIRNHLAKVKPGGILFYVIPDQRMGFDVRRQLTEFDHFLEDDQDGGARSRWDHYLEFSRFVLKPGDESEIIAAAKRNMDADYSIHFHVWDTSSWVEFLCKTRRYLRKPFEIIHTEKNNTENIAVLRKNG